MRSTVSAGGGRSQADVRADSTVWGRLVETAVGTHLVRAGLDVRWWRDGNYEVDYVVTRAGRVTAIEVKAGYRRTSLPGMARFSDRFRPDRRLLVGADGISLDDFLLSPATRYVA